MRKGGTMEMKKLDINVISEEELKDILSEVCQLMANCIKPTFGPYGQNTLVQSVDGVYSTKDGWNVAQRLRIIDPNARSTYPIAINAIKSLFLDTSFSVVLNGGDGTSTVMIAADALSRNINNFVKRREETCKSRPRIRPIDAKELGTELRETTKDIINELYAQSIHVNEENMEDIIYRTALISTNWDKEIAGIIRDIYKETKNPIIAVENSGTLETYASFTEGYELRGYLTHAKDAINNPMDGQFKTKHPVILTFAPGVALHESHLLELIAMSRILENERKQLIVMASLFDERFLNGLSMLNSQQIKAGLKPISLIPFKYFAKTAIDKDCVGDFSVLINSILLTQEKYQEYQDIFQEVWKTISEAGEDMPKDEKSKDYQSKLKEIDNLIDRAKERGMSAMYEIAGTCETLVATEDYILGSGFTSMNTEAFEKRRSSLEYDIFVQRKEANAESNLNDFLRLRRLRLGKMKCHMGTIKIGGFGKADLKSRKDAIDDATRACEVVYQDGYVVDGGLAIPKAILKLIKKGKGQETDGSRPFKIQILVAFFAAFREVAETLYFNRYRDKEKCQDIFDIAIKDNLCYDLLTETYDTSLITPVDVCKEVLNGCLRLVLVNATSNQFVYQDEDDLIRLIKAGSKTQEEINVETAQKELYDSQN